MQIELLPIQVCKSNLKISFCILKKKSSGGNENREERKVGLIWKSYVLFGFYLSIEILSVVLGFIEKSGLT